MSRSKREELKKEDSASTSSAVVAMLTPMLNDHKTSLSTEFNAAFSKLETKLDNIQTTILDHHQRLSSLESNADTTSEEVRAIEVRLATVTDENTKLKAKLIDLESRSRRCNIRMVGLPENIEGPHPTAFFSQLLHEVFGDSILDSAPELDRAHRSLAAKPGPGERPRPVVICFHRFQIRELVVREARKLRGQLKYKGTPFHIFEDYCPEIVEQRAVYRDVMKELYTLGLKPALLFPARLFVMTREGRRQRLASPKDAIDLIKAQRGSSSGSSGN